MMTSKKDSFWFWGAGLAILVAAAAIAVYFYGRDRATAPAEQTALETTEPEPADIAPPPEPEPAQPVRSVPLPPLDESDPEVVGGLQELVGQDAVTKFVKPERLVRNIVVTLDNLTREQVAVAQRPIKPTGGKFIATGPEDALVIAPENYDRYTPFVNVVKSIDAKTIASLYRGMQPLFQQAYEELGNPNALFNSRLLEVIDHLLQTPEVTGPVRLVQPSVHYKFADPKLESLSAGQKLLIRMGPENAKIIKAKLREIQDALS